MRLIDADKIKIFISELPKGENGYSQGYDESSILNFIDNQPTAYDVDKVVEQLVAESERWRESGEAYEDEKELGVADGFKRAIEIVKLGGIE